LGSYIAGQQRARFYDCLHFIYEKDGGLYGDFLMKNCLFILAPTDV